jgi:hypothetical protein
VVGVCKQVITGRMLIGREEAVSQDYNTKNTTLAMDCGRLED